MTIFTYEAVLSVCDYEDFDDAAEDHAAAIKQLEEDAAEQGITVKVISCTFADFDSGNPIHAGAYYQIDYEADEEVEM